MRIVAAICIAGGLLAGCSTPATQEGPSSTTAPSIQPGVMPQLVGLQWTDVNPILRKLGRVSVATKEIPVDDANQKSRIVTQDPAAGAHLEPGAKITLTFGI
ncbi:Serine/threonine-protein kinase PknB [Mycobacteroides salmoniphilum]|nr:Serine/threonine-protein kinase PknB [Mycobacteroides salmoniphilum]